MLEVVRHYVILLLGMMLTGLICAASLPFAHSPRGGVGPTIFQAESPIMAIIATAVAMAGAFIVSVFVGKLINSAVGLFVMGWGLAVFAMRTETVQEFALAGDSSLVLITLETLLWAGILLGMTLLMFRFAGAFKDIHPREYEQPPNPMRSPEAIKLFLPTVLVLPAVLLIAQSPMKGQVLGAVFIGSMLGSLISRLMSPHVQPHLLFAMPCMFGALGYVIGMFQLDGPIAEAFVTHTIPTLCLPMPVDYAAGSLMGVAVGLGWAKSFLHHEEEEGKAKTGEQTASV